MGCCGSKQAKEPPGAYEARREQMLAAASKRNAENEMRGIRNPKAAAKLREAQSNRRESQQGWSAAEDRRQESIAKDWN